MHIFSKRTFQTLIISLKILCIKLKFEMFVLKKYAFYFFFNGEIYLPQAGTET